MSNFQQYTLRGMSGVKAIVHSKKIFAIVGSVAALHESGVIDETEFENAKKNKEAKFGVIFRDDEDHVFYVQDLTKAKYLINTVSEVVNNAEHI